MNDFFCFLNKKCREDSSKELVDNLINEQNIVEELYSNLNNTDSEETSYNLK